MKDVFINKSFYFINKYKNLDHYNEIKIKYGLEVLYHFVTKLFVIILLSYFLGIIKQNLLIFLFYFFLRKYSHGLHAKSNIGCWFTSITVYVFMGLIAKYYTMYFPIMLIINLICLFSFILWSPADTKSRPIINKSDRRSLKFKTVLFAVLELLVFVFINKFRLIITLVFMLQSIVINPFIYKITKSPFNNYLVYNS